MPVRRHARAVILLGYWLLMMPPFKEGEPRGGSLREQHPEWFTQSPAAPGEAPSTTTLAPGQRPISERFTPVERDNGAPITQWTQVAAFDTAKECETERAKHQPQGKAVESYELPAGVVPGGVQQKDMGWYFARCVPAEAVYPPQPPARK